MKNQTLIKFTQIIILVSLYSCDSNENNNVLKLISNDSLLSERYILTGVKPGYKNSYRKEFKYTVSTYKYAYDLDYDLDTLENGFKDFQLRFWLGHSLAKEHQILIIRSVNNVWSSDLYRYYWGEKKQIVSKNIKPKHNLKTIVNQLYEKGLFDIKDANEVDGYECGGGADGITYDIEIATPTKYRLITYCELEPYNQQFTEVNTIKEITELLEKEFGFRITR